MSTPTHDADARWKTKFARAVRRYGVAKLAHELQINPTAVYQWIRGSVSPRPDKAMAVVILLRPISHMRLQDVYEHRLAIRGADLQMQLDSRPDGFGAVLDILQPVGRAR